MYSNESAPMALNIMFQDAEVKKKNLPFLVFLHWKAQH